MEKKTMMKVVAGSLITAVCLAGGYFWYSGGSEGSKEGKLETVTATKMDLKSTVSATGTIKPIDSVEVSSKITARIATVLVKENDRVAKGQIVATLDGKDYEAKREQARFKVVNAKAKFDRVSYLYSIGADTQDQYEDAVYQYDTARSNLEVTESDLAETIITAPMDGVVVGEPKTPGTMAVQGNNNPTVIMQIADLSKKQIKAKIDETDIGNVRVGQSAIFTVDAYTNKNFNAKVTKISQTDVTSSWDTSSASASANSSASVIYYYVTLDVEDQENLLLPGMTARVDVVTSEKNSVLAIPISSLKTNKKGPYVLVVDKKGNTEERSIKVGIYSDDFVEVLDGLQEGDVISNSYKATNKQKNSNAGRAPGGMPRMRM